MPGKLEVLCRDAPQARIGGRLLPTLTPVITCGTLRPVPERTRRIILRIGGILALSICVSGPLFAQDQSGSPGEPESSTRAAQIQTERLKKATNLAPEDLTPGERRLTD